MRMRTARSWLERGSSRASVFKVECNTYGNVDLWIHTLSVTSGAAVREVCRGLVWFSRDTGGAGVGQT